MKIPDSPPITNIRTKAKALSIAVVKRIEPPQRVPSQLKVLIAEGTAITMVETPNAAESTRFIPETNI